MKTEEGLVIEVTGNTARIKAGKHNECKDCGACPGNESAIVTARNPIGAKPGQRVLFEVKEANALKGAFIIFILPLLAVAAGAILGGIAGNLVGISLLIGRILGGLLAFILVILFIKLFDKAVSKSEKSLPVIERILI